jgi:hypothetical protein
MALPEILSVSSVVWCKVHMSRAFAVQGVRNDVPEMMSKGTAIPAELRPGTGSTGTFSLHDVRRRLEAYPTTNTLLALQEPRRIVESAVWRGGGHWVSRGQPCDAVLCLSSSVLSSGCAIGRVASGSLSCFGAE